MTTELPRETAAGFTRLKPTRPTPEFNEFLETLRTVQDLAVAVNAPADVLAEATLQARALIEMIESHAAPEGQSVAGRAVTPGRGHLMLPAWRIEAWNATGVRGKGMFRRYHLGGNGAAHGGAIALLFDEQCGMAIFAAGHPVARTAYLHVNYRNLTPLDVELTVQTRIDRIDGRKRYVVSELTGPSGTVLADAEALMIELPPA